jgi:hypothetical protein
MRCMGSSGSLEKELIWRDVDVVHPWDDDLTQKRMCTNTNYNFSKEKEQ